MKNGKMPISEKKIVDSMSAYHDTQEASLLEVDPTLKSFLDSQGLSCRWLNAQKYVKGGGFHKDGWRALRMPDVPPTIRSAITLGGGESPEGYLVRNDLLLAVRGENIQKRHEQRLRDANDRKMGVNRANAEKLREHIGQAGGKVHEGYDDND